MANPSFLNGTVTVGTTATLLCSVVASADVVLVSSSAAAFIGGSTVTAAGATGGLPLPANTPIRVPTPGEQARDLYAITGTGTANISFCYPA